MPPALNDQPADQHDEGRARNLEQALGRRHRQGENAAELDDRSVQQLLFRDELARDPAE
jgi:hypothetical protein